MVPHTEETLAAGLVQGLLYWLLFLEAGRAHSALHSSGPEARSDHSLFSDLLLPGGASASREKEEQML